MFVVVAANSDGSKFGIPVFHRASHRRSRCGNMTLKPIVSICILARLNHLRRLCPDLPDRCASGLLCKQFTNFSSHPKPGTHTTWIFVGIHSEGASRCGNIIMDSKKPLCFLPVEPRRHRPCSNDLPVVPANFLPEIHS